MSCAWADPDGAAAHGRILRKRREGRGLGRRHRSHRRPNFSGGMRVAELSQKSDYWLGKQGRLTRADAAGRRGDALRADRLGRCLSPDRRRTERAWQRRDDAIFYTSGRTSNEAAFLYQLFVRQFGTNNLPDCSNMCHESSGSALSPTIGIGKGTVKLEDFDRAQTIILIGQNPGTNHPRMLTALASGQAARGEDHRHQSAARGRG